MGEAVHSTEYLRVAPILSGLQEAEERDRRRNQETSFPHVYERALSRYFLPCSW